MYAIRSYYGKEVLYYAEKDTLHVNEYLLGKKVGDKIEFDRITSYNVCYTKLLRTAKK